MSLKKDFDERLYIAVAHLCAAETELLDVMIELGRVNIDGRSRRHLVSQAEEAFKVTRALELAVMAHTKQ